MIGQRQRVRPPPRPYVAPVAGSGAATYATVLGWGALYDPSGFVASSSVQPDGELRFTMAGDTTLYDGINEACPRREVRIQDIPGCEGFDPLLHLVEVYGQVLQLDPGTDQYGLLVAVMDDDTSGLAGASGIGARLARFNALNHQHQCAAATGGTGGTDNLGLTTTFRYIWDFTRVGAASVAASLLPRYGVPSQVYEQLAAAGVQTGGLELDGSQYVLQAGVRHGSTTTGTPTIRARLHARLLRRATVTP